MKIRHVLKYTVLVALLVSCSKKEKLKISVSFVEFSTDIKITVFDVEKKDEERINRILAQTEEIFRYFNSELNPYDSTSTLSVLNNFTAGKKVSLPESLRKILKISQNIYKYTDKSFDIAVQPLVELWGFNTLSTPVKPDSILLKDILKISDSESFQFFNDSIIASDGRCRIGFGGIAKGYAVDSVRTFLRLNGLDNFIVAAGGDVYVNSRQQKTVGIRHPREKNAVIDTLFIADAAVSTSGDYEKYFIDDGIRYCHIINPATGYGTSDIISATVISDKSYMSDAFATAVFVMGREKGRYFIEKNELGGIIYYLSGDGKILSERINIDNYTKKEHVSGTDR
jgi:FAD:protein FMN transferase